MAFRQSAAQGVSVSIKDGTEHPRTRLRLVSVSQWRQIQKGLVVVVYDMDRLRRLFRRNKPHRTYKRVSIKSPQSLNGMDVFV